MFIGSVKDAYEKKLDRLHDLERRIRIKLANTNRRDGNWVYTVWYNKMEQQWEELMLQVRGWNSLSGYDAPRHTDPRWLKHCEETGRYPYYDFGDVLA